MILMNDKHSYNHINTNTYIIIYIYNIYRYILDYMRLPVCIYNERVSAMKEILSGFKRK